ncbi:hypothetical protein N7478_001366 [Penicillium angulare]|uniref:uncharacterized protein n=1 Tax=Penicillium angulare TaxID=116970 RepID=UPI0025412E18|nr:uncharacterized protein N7478_001366 [Penicillium angulare]KAJ5292115.1 hypothetical protein N7478_001366 [Penicillium angulare]
MEPLKTMVVSHIISDDEELKKQFGKLTSDENCEIQGWITSKPVEILGKLHHAPRVIGPSDHLSAVIVDPNWGTGLAKIIFKGQERETLHTRSHGGDEAVMIFLQPGFHCVITGRGLLVSLKPPMF